MQTVIMKGMAIFDSRLLNVPCREHNPVNGHSTEVGCNYVSSVLEYHVLSAHVLGALGYKESGGWALDTYKTGQLGIYICLATYCNSVHATYVLRSRVSLPANP